MISCHSLAHFSIYLFHIWKEEQQAHTCQMTLCLKTVLARMTSEHYSKNLRLSVANPEKTNSAAAWQILSCANLFLEETSCSGSVSGRRTWKDVDFLIHAGSLETAKFTFRLSKPDLKGTDCIDYSFWNCACLQVRTAHHSLLLHTSTVYKGHEIVWQWDTLWEAELSVISLGRQKHNILKLTAV